MNEQGHSCHSKMTTKRTRLVASSSSSVFCCYTALLVLILPTILALARADGIEPPTRPAGRAHGYGHSHSSAGHGRETKHRVGEGREEGPRSRAQRMSDNAEHVPQSSVDDVSRLGDSEAGYHEGHRLIARGLTDSKPSASEMTVRLAASSGRNGTSDSLQLDDQGLPRTWHSLLPHQHLSLQSHLPLVPSQWSLYGDHASARREMLTVTFGYFYQFCYKDFYVRLPSGVARAQQCNDTTEEVLAGVLCFPKCNRSCEGQSTAGGV